MQPSGDLPQARALPRIWVWQIKNRLGCTDGDLDHQLPQKPNGHVFRAGKNPPPLNIRSVFRRVVDDGHWPDNDKYMEHDLSGSYNLFRRVSEWDPGSQDWLFSPLKRAALELPHDLPVIRDGISMSLSRFGLARLPLVPSFVVAQWMLGINEQRYRQLFSMHWDLIANIPEPLHVTLLTLLYQESCATHSSPFSDWLLPYCVRGWSRLLRRPEFLKDRKFQELGLLTCRNILLHIKTANTIYPGKFSRPEHYIYSNCPIWAPTPEGEAAAAELKSYWESNADRILQGPLPGKRPLLKRDIDDLPQAAKEAFLVVVACIARARTAWAKWDNLSLPPASHSGRVRARKSRSARIGKIGSTLGRPSNISSR